MKTKPMILLAEDEPALGQIIKESLQSRKFDVVLCDNGEDTLKQFYKDKPDLLVLDVMMPKKDGLTLTKEIRLVDQTIPIIFLTAKSQTQDVINGFESGGNDYLKKPFSMEELIVRINNLINRIETKTPVDRVQLGLFTFSLTTQQLQFKMEDSIALTHRESHLLYHLIQTKNQVLDRSAVLKELWGSDDFFNARSMDVFISKLRKKLKQDKTIQIINVRGYGYKLIAE